MKFSEAVVLGSTMIRFSPWMFLDRGKTCGCLKGMAHRAISDNQYTPKLILETWPWLDSPVKSPAGCLFAAMYDDQSAYHLINFVALEIERGAITFGAAIDWIRANEPEETPEEKRAIVEQYCAQLVGQ